MKITTKEWIEKVSIIHNNKYDYSKSIYVHSKSKLIIICPEHGEFLQTPNSHNRGTGCPKCHYYKVGNNNRDTNDSFIEKATLVHGNRYDYSLVDYIQSDKKVIIICKIHGEFKQTPHNHLSGNNCPKCKSIKMSSLFCKTTTQFISDANKIHNFRYDYSHVKYTSAFDKIEIGCSIHGIFKQLPNKHLSGQGCPVCKLSKGEIVIFNWLKENGIPFKHQFKLDLSKILIGINLFIVDFFIKHDNKQYFIEYDGIQHFEYQPYFHKNDKDFKKQQMRDKALDEFCKVHKDSVTLIRFRYDEDDLKIINTLNKVFCGNK